MCYRKTRTSQVSELNEVLNLTVAQVQNVLKVLCVKLYVHSLVDKLKKMRFCLYTKMAKKRALKMWLSFVSSSVS